ncbi:translocation protein TolB [Candidatus Venteria ishoeyi]|uniref:Translocation protein TolB n=1 Tax=Candidatus Venteria ishoeyi TaxID=1899563 RepID=A0A1H6F3Y8_9GAMM|nr:translocation protein TolB [Candidatus Venteria ishoeyi]
MKIWDASSGIELISFSGHTYKISAVAYSPDGNRIVSASYDMTLKIWDADSGFELNSLIGHTGWVNAVAYSPDGEKIVSGSNDSTLKIWNADSGIELSSLSGHTVWVRAVAYSPDGTRIVSGSVDQTLKIWDTSTAIAQRTLGYNHTIDEMFLSPDGSRIVSTSGYNNSLKIWDSNNGVELLNLPGHNGTVVTYSPDGSRVVSTGNDNTLKIWDAGSGDELITLSGHTNWITAVAYSPDGSRIVSTDYNGTLKIWDAVSGIELNTLPGHTDAIFTVAYSPDGNRIVSGSYDKTLKIWDVDNGIELNTLSGHTHFVYAVAYSPDGNRIVSGSWDKTLKIWDTGTGTELNTLSGHTDWVITLTYSPDGSRIVSGSRDKTLKIWDANTGIELHSLEAHTDGIDAVTFSPTGRRIYSGSADRTIKVWDSGLVTTPLLALPDQLELTLNTTQTITPTQGSAIRWESSDPAIASVDNSGKLTGLMPGTVSIMAYDADGIRQTMPVTVMATANDSPGRAMVIASGWAWRQNTLFDITEELTLRMYRLLRQRGFSDEDIVYFNPHAEQDLDGDGYPDSIVDYQFFDAPLEELKTAFTEIATSLQPGQQFVFYLHGHAEPNRIQRLNRSTDLEAAALKDLLNSLPDYIEQVIIVDTCYSGSFIDDLKDHPKRIVITSSDALNVTWNQQQQTFTDFFIDAARRSGEGNNLYDVFAFAEQRIISNPGFYGHQKPQLDDNGDGFSNTTQDRLHAEKTWIGRPGITGNVPPDIIGVHNILQLAPGDSAQLWVKTQPAEPSQLRKVRARLSQQNQLALYTGLNSTFAPHEIELHYDPAQQRYQADFSDFNEAGTWRVEYRARGLDGVWSAPAIGEIQVSAANVDNGFNPALPVQSLAQFNLSAYRPGERLYFDVQLKGNIGVYDKYDLYAGIIFPDGTVYSFGYPDQVHTQGELKPYRSQLNVTGERSFNILDIPLPPLPPGNYQGCSLITPTGVEPWQSTNWTHIDCQTFRME